MDSFYLLFIVFFVASIMLQSLWIAWLNSRSFNLVQKAYGPERTVAKMKTPAMGGAVFMALSLPGTLACWLFGSEPFLFYVIVWSLPFFSAAIGLWDDLLKWSRKSSEGLRSLQKLFLQILVAVLWSVIAHGFDCLSLYPGLILSPTMTVILVAFIVVSMLNAVNVTDGLDGLASGASVISLISLAFMVSRGLESIWIGLAISTSFLWHNSYPARVFMGDCGSHFLGGLLVSIAVCGGGALYVVPSGALFGFEILSVAIQIVSIRFFGKKVFLMSPLHHHFEILGWNEVQIVTRFWLIHLFCVVSAMWIGFAVIGLLGGCLG
ncbi:MAG: phospho-N-acetylmuramoyl-pentapeptide-transferase [Synergistales bacterium]|nr:phospho-N-acetylmuramoyl-pentapeptide-transferase [Dethiosulfovibrio sp.]NCC95727.1 phospho-N-acetylmuramoyl-pentapeptide-transferase [Synergistales bacterium]